MVVNSKLLHTEFGPNDIRKHAPYFIISYIIAYMNDETDLVDRTILPLYYYSNNTSHKNIQIVFPL